MIAGILRYLLGAVGFIAGIPLLLMSGLISLLSPAAGPNRLPPAMAWTFLALGALLVVIGAFSWYRAVKVTPGDDLFSEQRGLLVSLIVITALLIAGGTLFLVLNPGFWSGAMEGLLD